MELSEDLRSELLKFQKNEITEYHIYKRLAEATDSTENQQVLERIAHDELLHYQGWKKYTQQEVKPDRWKILKFYWISRVLGLTFGIQLMERGEETAQDSYGHLKSKIAEIERVIEEEHDHEDALIQMINEEHLDYVGSIVLGLNDALVELTGALAGFTLALQDTRLIALSGAITGVAAALSMAASEYLSTRSEETSKEPAKAAVYTGMAYILTVVVLIFPFLILPNYYLSLVITLTSAVIIIAMFNYYVSVVKNVPFRRRFVEMAGVSLGVAALSFLIGYIFRRIIGVDL